MTNSKVIGDELLTKAEGTTFDRKSSAYDINKLVNILIAFANADGGIVAVGIKDKTFEGINKLSDKKINDFLQMGLQLVKPKLEIESEFKDVINNQGHPDRVLLLEVNPSSNKIYSNMKDEVYVRVGDETHKLSFEERKHLEYTKGIRAYESQIVKEAILEDLDLDVVEEYKQKYGFTGNNLWDLLFPKGLAKRDNTTPTKYRLTVAGILLLAKTPTTFVPGARIRFIRYEGKEEETGTEMNIVKQALFEGPLPKLLEMVSRELESQLRTFVSLDLKTGKFMEIPEYPKGAWLEGLVNAVTHRSYNYTGDDIRIIMFDDHLKIHSPGPLPPIVSVDNIRNMHYSRNPYIARALTDFSWVREFGEGVDRIYNDMGKFFLDDPIYKVDQNAVDLILENNIVMRSFRKNDALEAKVGKIWTDLNYVEQKALQIAYEKGKLRTSELEKEADVSNYSARKALKKLMGLNILTKISTSRTSPSQYYKLVK
ncbi:ATP-binding protein [Xylocopilactobacillus apicola]|uniref:ATP-dependent DNA helicase RecG n=1 Tax=Xylocopilactobacillus apicola TaxID=2932184 RepID=A0AAU9D6V6_9LACO|nr:ATP-binding protein [Xylocopilactobacillus apicola]BDR59589.1 ATP-dependent DNA helicase RecG [Xylocopilactobacillus apicola]